MAYVEWTPDMGEISGFGGGYEGMCRTMVKAGVDFWDAEDVKRVAVGADPFDPRFHGYKGIYGVISEDNDDAKALTEAVLKPTNGDCTGAMHQASINHILAFKRLGAEEYCRVLREREKAEAEEPTP